MTASKPFDRKLALEYAAVCIAVFATQFFMRGLITRVTAVIIQLLYGLVAYALIENHQATDTLKSNCMSKGRQFAFGIVLALAWGIAVCLVFGIFGSISLFPMRGYSAGDVVYLLLFKLLVGICEELLVRGYLAGVGTKLFRSQWFAIVFSSLLFGLMHLVINRNWIQFVFTTVFGLVNAAMYLKLPKCSMLTLITTHTIYNYLCDFVFTT